MPNIYLYISFIEHFLPSLTVTRPSVHPSKTTRLRANCEQRRRDASRDDGGLATPEHHIVFRLHSFDEI